MTFLVPEVLLHTLAVPVVPLAGIFTLALAAPIAQPVLISASLVEFAFGFPLVTSTALFHFLPP
jgi:hypothetical protein